MRLEKYSIDKLKKELKKIVSQYLNLKNYRLFFFGSRVTGKGNNVSDIDVGIEGHEEIPLEIMSKIKEDVENLPILYKMEIMDFKRASRDFLTVALQNIEEIK
ncbi:MAG: nucleotidyltransferase domain-containing protein [Candidatus Magasanikbacteria bacterium]